MLFTSVSRFTTQNERFKISGGAKGDNGTNLAKLNPRTDFPFYYSLMVTNLATLVNFNDIFHFRDFLFFIFPPTILKFINISLLLFIAEGDKNEIEKKGDIS